MKSRAPTRQKRRVLIDTGAFYAFADAIDAHHRESVAIFTDLRDKGDYLLTTSFIVAETHALLLNRLHRQAAIQFLKDMKEGSYIAVIWATPNDVKQAGQTIYRYEDKKFTLTDATSFAVMERLGIQYAFTFDRNFAQHGLNVLAAT
ncbi:MAG: PIN domain-containing protein [Chloroflexi bacterium]|nr:PIN domain-containing protein [Chloroflexota bacterium]